MSGARELLVIVAPLRLTLWVLAVATAVIVVLIAIGVSRHLESIRTERRREHVRAELGPVFSTFVESQHPMSLADELGPAFMRMDAAHRPVAAELITDIMSRASPAQKDQLRDALEETGLVELGHRGTRRRSPWRRALACEMLGKIGARRSVPVLLERLKDRRPEVRTAAVRALGDIGSEEAVPALSEAFLGRRVAPPNVVDDALRRIGGGAVTAFEQGVRSPDPIVRVSSCFGLSATAQEPGACAFHLSLVLDTDADARVRTAAAAGLGTTPTPCGFCARAGRRCRAERGCSWWRRSFPSARSISPPRFAWTCTCWSCSVLASAPRPSTAGCWPRLGSSFGARCRRDRRQV
jgi:HEAT repeats